MRVLRILRLISIPLAVAFLIVLIREFEYNKGIIDGISDSLYESPEEFEKYDVPADVIKAKSPVVINDPALANMLAKDGFKVINDFENPKIQVAESPKFVLEKADSQKIPAQSQGFAQVQGKSVDHGMMDQSDVEVVAVKAAEIDDLPSLKSGLSEDKEYDEDFTWPGLNELDIPQEWVDDHQAFYSRGSNRLRQFNHDTEIPEKRNPDLIITGAKKCGTTALKIFMSYHKSFQDTAGERHFFNRPANFNMGYGWYLDQMPLVFKDEVCYEKTPDYFDRPFVPERMVKLENAQDIKFIHVLCDPVRRSFSHFLHMFTVQAIPKGGSDHPQPGFEFLEGNFGELPKEEAFEQTINLAFKNLLNGKDIDTVTDDEIRDSINEYFTRWDLKPGDPRRVFPLRAPDNILTGGLYSIHIRTFLHHFRQDQMLYLDSTELIENPGKSLRRVAIFMDVPQIINENNFYFDDEKGYFCMTPPVDTGRKSFCLGSSKGRSKDKTISDEVKNRIRRFYRPFLEDLSTKYTAEKYGHWDW